MKINTIKLKMFEIQNDILNFFFVVVLYSLKSPMENNICSHTSLSLTFSSHRPFSHES